MYLGWMPRRLWSSSAAAFLVERNADRLDAEPVEAVERAEIGDLLYQHGVAAREQQSVDELDPLQGTGGDQDLVGGAGNAGVARELGDQELAQRPIAERAAFEAIGRKRPALAGEHCRRRGNQVIYRHMLGVVVPADEIVFRKSGVLHRRGR
jgi:hypothetical protein